MTVNEFLEVIEEDIAMKNPNIIKTRIGNLAIACRDFEGQHAELYKDIIRAVMKAHPELFEQFNGSPALASKEKTDFTETDFTDAVFELRQNLCIERIKDVMAIGNAVYGKHESTAAHPADEPSSSQTASASSEYARTKKAQGVHEPPKQKRASRSQDNQISPLVPIVAAGIVIAAVVWLITR